MVAPRKPRRPIPQMFTPAPAASPVQPTGMFTAPIKTAQGTKANPFDWVSLVQGLGAGLLTGDNFAEGAGQGLIYARQFADQRADNERQQERVDRENARFDYTMAKDQRADAAAAEQAAARNAAIDAMNLPPEQKALLKAQVVDYGDVVPKPQGASSGIGKIMEDLRAGLIDEATANALIKKETYIAPQQGPQEPERVRLALAAGLTPGTPEYQQFLLGRDDTPTGPFQGTGMDQQAYNIVLTGDPASPEYAAAYSQLAQPKVTMDANTGQLVSVQPNIGWARKPAGMADPTTQGTTTTNVPGATITSRQPDVMASTPEQRNAFKKQSLALDNLETAITEYEAALDKFGAMETWGEGKGILENAYANILIQAKEAANLGALTGPDMDIMGQTVIAPNSYSQATVGGAKGVKAQINSFRKQLDQKRKNLNALYGPQGTSGPAPSSSGSPDYKSKYGLE